MGPMWIRGVSAAGGLRQNLPNFPRGIVLKFPMDCSPSEYIAWEQRFEFFIADQDLRHTISPDAPEIAVTSCTNNAYRFGQFGENLVLEHRRVWGYISEATADAPFENNSLYKCHSISDALRMMREWPLPLYPAERHLLVAELERVQFMGDEESEVVQFILRQFPERPSHPHALVVGRGFRGGGAVGGGSMPRQQQQRQQHWSRDSGIPRQQQQLQHWFHDGGIPRQQQQQQQWSRGGGNPHQHQRSSHTVPPARPARQQPSGESIRQEATGSTAGTPFQHLRLKRCPTPVSSPLRLRRLWRKRPRHQRARHRRQYLQQRRRPAVLFSPLHRWGGRPGRPLLQMKQRHRRRHRRPAVLFPRLHHLGGQSGRASRLLERRHRTLYRRRHRRPAVLLPRLHHVGGQSLRVSRLLERHHRTWQRRRFHWRSATTTTAATAVTTSSAAVTAVTTTAAAAVTTTAAAATRTPPQLVL